MTTEPPDPDALAAWSGGDGEVGVVVVHGFTGNPASMRPWAEHLAASGFRVELPLLPGHGTTWRDMAITTYEDWYSAVERAYLSLAAECRTVAVVALSMGGALALRLAARQAVAALVLVNPSVRTTDKRFLALPLLSRAITSIPAIGDDIAKPGVREYAYDRTPLRSVVQLTRLWADVRPQLGDVTTPLLLFRSRTDHVVDPSSAELILSSISSPIRRERLLNHSFHVATLDYDAPAIFSESVAFLREVIS